MTRLIPRIVLPTVVALLAACQTESTRLLSEPDPGILASSFGTERTPWSEPVRLDAPVNDATAIEQGPALSPDGLSLYFCSNRAGGSGGNDLWASRRASEEDAWSEPVNLGPTVNSSAGDCGPSFSQDGLLLFFTSARAGGAGANDIYMASRTDPTDDLSWSAPVRLGPEVNTPEYEFSPFVTKWADDGTAELYFERGGRETTDIFAVTIDASGAALGSAIAVDELNTAAGDQHATVRFDGREVLLASNRDGGWDLFVATRISPNHPWSTPVPVDELNSSLHEIHPYLSRDGRTVAFSRGGDIWMSSRTPSGQ